MHYLSYVTAITNYIISPILISSHHKIRFKGVLWSYLKTFFSVSLPLWHFKEIGFMCNTKHCNICMTTIFILYPRISYPKSPTIFPPSFQALVDRHETLHGYQTSNCFVEDDANPAKSK